jgi:hypothetical protein
MKWHWVITFTIAITTNVVTPEMNWRSQNSLDNDRNYIKSNVRPELVELALAMDPREQSRVVTSLRRAGTSWEPVLGQPTTVLACVPLARFVEMKSELESAVRGVQPIFNSRQANASCFLVYDESEHLLAAAAALQSNLTLFVRVPSAAKLSSSLYHHDNVEEGSGTLDAIKISKIFESERPADGLVVTFAPGASLHTFHWLKETVIPAAHQWILAPPSDHSDVPLILLLDEATENDSICNFTALSLSDNINAPLEGTERMEPGGPVVHLSGLKALWSSEGILRRRCLIGLLGALVQQNDVLHVEPKAHARAHNARSAKLAQTAANSASPYLSATPIWDMGINGTGQIIGMADSGLDTASCFFSDSSGSSAVARSSVSSPKVDYSQSKVVQYVSYADSQDTSTVSHGTHVVGSAVGNIGSRWEDFTTTRSKDSCAAASSSCLLMDTYSDCDTYTDYCSTFSDVTASVFASCADTCYCTLGFFTATGSTSGSGETCGELLEDSKGIAFGARVAFFDLGDSSSNLHVPSNINSIFPSAYNAGARVHSNSWGNAYVQSYSNSEIQIDTYSYQHPQMLLIFSAGNTGEYGKAKTIESPAHAKNILTVGASQTGRWPAEPSYETNVDYVASFSASGPSTDGRVKPDLVAPGMYTLSALSNGYSASPSCAIYAAGGTSQAAPIVAGAASLVREYLSSSPVFVNHMQAVASDLNWQHLPGYPSGGMSGGTSGMALTGAASGALIKAMLIHSTVKMTTWDTGTAATPQRVTLGNPPDFHQGFGRLDLSQVLLTEASTPAKDGASLWVTDSGSLLSGKSISYTLHLVSAAQPLKATLAWYDPANSVSASKQLLHDLDLTITDESTGHVYYSNGKTASTQDELNTVEKVSIETPPSVDSDYTVTVSASVMSSTQSFALVITGAGYIMQETYTWTRLCKARDMGGCAQGAFILSP